MTLTWTERIIEIWGRSRPCFESYVFNGLYRVLKIESEHEGKTMRFNLAQHGVDSCGVCYRASFAPIVSSEDTVRPRHGESSDFMHTPEEAKRWCQEREDRYQDPRNEPRPMFQGMVQDTRGESAEDFAR